MELERRAAGHRAVDVAVVDAQVLGHGDGVVDHHPAATAGADVAVDLRLLDAGVGDGPLRGEHVVLHAVEVRGLGVVGQADPHDDRCAIHDGGVNHKRRSMRSAPTGQHRTDHCGDVYAQISSSDCSSVTGPRRPAPPGAHRPRHRGRGPRLRLGLDGRVVELGRVLAARRVGGGAHDPHRLWHRHRPDRRPARRPTMAMHAMTLDACRTGRFRLGHRRLGPAGGRGLVRPAVRASRSPAPASTSTSCARCWRARGAGHERRAALPAPLHGPGAVGLGKPLKMITHPLRGDIPIYLGAEGPKNVRAGDRDRRRLAAALLLAVPPRGVRRPLADAPDGFEIAVNVIGDDRRRRRPRRCWPVKATLGFYIGGMGAKAPQLPHRPDGPDGLRGRGAPHPGPVLRGQARRGDAWRCPTSSPTRSRSSARRSASASGSRRGAKTPVTTLLIGRRDPDTLRFLADLTR